MISVGIIMRIEEIIDNEYSLVYGVVRPGAVRFTQHLKKTKVTYDITGGIGEMEIEKPGKKAGEEKEKIKLKRKKRKVLEPGQKHGLINQGKEPWRFKGKFEPPWDPDNVMYEYRGKAMPGHQIWFELKKSIGDTTPGVKYCIGRFSPEVSEYRVLLEPRVQGLVEYHEEEKHTITGTKGKGIVFVDGVQQEFGKGDTLVLEPMQKLQLINPGSHAWEMKGKAEPHWDPDDTFYILPDQIIVPGNDIWFDTVLPYGRKDI